VIAVSAGAPFMETWSALLVGAIAGFLVPISTYFVMERMRLDDAGGVIAMHGVGGIIGLLAPAFFATGLYGAGWNLVGSGEYLGVTGQGVTGLLAAVGRQPDWPGQLTAQAAAIAASIIFPGLLAFVVFQAIHRLVRAWQPAGEELQKPAVLQDETASQNETIPQDETISQNETASQEEVVPHSETVSMEEDSAEIQIESSGELADGQESEPALEAVSVADAMPDGSDVMDETLDEMEDSRGEMVEKEHPREIDEDASPEVADLCESDTGATEENPTDSSIEKSETS